MSLSCLNLLDGRRIFKKLSLIINVSLMCVSEAFGVQYGKWYENTSLYPKSFFAVCWAPDTDQGSHHKYGES